MTPPARHCCITVPAKVNLLLKVLSKRNDGYHDLLTIVEKIALYDRITIVPRPDGKIKVDSDVKGISGKKNLAYKAAELLLKEKGLFGKKGVGISIQKHIPIGAGLGGGASDAAGVLQALNTLYSPRIPGRRLIDIGRKIGADVMFFLEKGPFLVGVGRPDRVRTIAIRKKPVFWHLIIWPKITIPTPYIYKLYDISTPRKAPKFALTTHYPDVRIGKQILGRLAQDGPEEVLHNDLQQVVERAFPRVKDLAAYVWCKAGTQLVVTGSGSALYTISRDKTALLKIKNALPKALIQSAFIVSTA